VRVREALAKCGYQLRWHRLDRVTVGEGGEDASPPTTPFALHLDTVMLRSREKVDFVKTDADASAPLYAGKMGFRFNKAEPGLADKIARGEVIGLEKTILVHAGEVVGSAGKAASDASLHGIGAFVHPAVWC